jgi:SAM-dependent methyltransferase
MSGSPVDQPTSSPPGGWNAGFDGIPEDYDRLRAAGHMSRRRLDILTDLLRGSRGKVVELGCGTGTLLRRLAERLPDRTFLGVEPLANYVEFARARAAAEGLGNVSFAVGTGERFASVAGRASAGAVISVDALHHVSDVGRTIAEVAEVAEPGAHWFAMEPDRLHPYVLAYHVLTAGERTFPAREFVRHATGAGWRLGGRRRYFLYPSGVQRVPGWAATLERRVEGVPVLSGAVLLDLVRETDR